MYHLTKHASHFLAVVFGATVFWITPIYGQDMHFSQFYASPLNLNPALTGLSTGQHRIMLNYRNQWGQVSSPFITYGLSYDVSFLDLGNINETLQNDMAAAGISLLQDGAGPGSIQTFNGLLSFAYHKAIGDHTLAAGFQGGVLQRTFNPQDLLFPNQWSPTTGADPNIPHGQQFEATSVIIAHFNAGLLWYYFFGSGNSLFLGGSIFNLGEPDFSFTGISNPLHHRYVGHAGSKISVSEQLFVIPNVLFMQQGASQQINPGAALEVGLGTNASCTVGGWYRLDDAFIAVASIELQNLKLGLSYDINTSPLKTVTQQRGGFELSLIYNFNPGQDVEIKSHPGPNI